MQTAYDHPGHVIVASSGDSGFTAANFPANRATVTAAGGTELARARNAGGWSERVWNITQVGASGSGCSAYVAKPSWQRDRRRPGRTVADVSALAWNIAVYDKAQDGWLTVGGSNVCGGDYLRAARKGYDAPTGLGTPDGTGAF